MAESLRAREVGASPLRASPARKPAELLGRGVGRVLALDREKSKELRQIARIGLDGVGCSATLGAQHVEKQRKL